ncbi:ATP-binding protein [Micromonospora sp. NPDC005979]|uniref:ATP-binding protein n=1 Tax=Micromonospora sp. NPDC005979 TaxID=3156726 RepID=UPI0033A99431
MSILNLSRPPPGAAVLRRWMITGSGDLATLRMSLSRCLTRLSPLPEDLRQEFGERVNLVATELATNALQHGAPPAIVRLLGGDDCVILDVADSDLFNAPRLTEPTVIDFRGRGLMISRTLSTRIGWYTTTTAKHTWAVFAYVPR